MASLLWTLFFSHQLSNNCLTYSRNAKTWEYRNGVNEIESDVLFVWNGALKITETQGHNNIRGQVVRSWPCRQGHGRQGQIGHSRLHID